MKVCPKCGSTNISSYTSCDICMDCNTRFNEVSISLPEYYASGTGTIMPKKMVVYEPEIRDDGIYVPVKSECYEGTSPAYKLFISKEKFVEAFEKYILPSHINAVLQNSIPHLVTDAMWKNRKSEHEWVIDDTIYPKDTYLLCVTNDDQFCHVKIADGIHKYNDLPIITTINYD